VRGFLFNISFFIAFSLNAATVDTVEVYSKVMHKSFKCVVIKPQLYKKEELRFPVVYLLHGYGGWYSNWIIRVPQLNDYADKYNIIIVCPDGGPSSWYFDSPLDSSMRYETYIGEEVPAFIDKRYHTIKDRNARAITGLSMGGHGALFIAFRHAGDFGACGSISGGVDLNSSKNKYDIQKRIGDTIKYADNWTNYSVKKVVEQYPKDSLAIIMDCGLSDAFFKDNRSLHEKMLALKIPHDYIERPGKHEWPYWRNSIEYHLLFFNKYFDKMGTRTKAESKKLKN
jgi:S-formylglutathione hydrolase FrmB